MYIYTGGEPLVRKRDLMHLCRAHNDCQFLCFTNATLIDEAFADEMLRVGNFIPAISLEGDEADTDGRRGKGTYQSVLIAAELLPTPEQRSAMYHRIRDYRARKSLFAMDFQNDAEYVGGYIASRRRYLHINANGDMDPCVFIHYSDSNIREKSLLDALRSPLFMAYHDGQPFNKNMLRPCPMLENPEKLRKMVADTGAVSTDPLSPESADHLCGKCDHYAACWAPAAEALWASSPAGRKDRPKTS